MKLAIHQPHYLPWLGYFAKWAAADLFVFLDTVQYEKNGWQNRNRIKTREGPRWLTVPVRARLGTPIRDVLVDASQPWRPRHFAAIEAAYGGAPCWARYRDELHAVYDRAWERLAPVAVASAEWLAQKLGIRTPTRLASEIGLPAGVQADATARLVALCRAAGADTYLAGRDGALYMDMAQFAAAGIAVETQQYEHPVYAQEHGEFVPSLSAVDLLLNHGDEALGILCEGSTWSRLSPEPT
jgi:WbqC-like protein family